MFRIRGLRFGVYAFCGVGFRGRGAGLCNFESLVIIMGYVGRSSSLGWGLLKSSLPCIQDN